MKRSCSKIANFEHQPLFRSQCAGFFFSKKIVKWEQVKITNMTLQRPEVYKLFLNSKNQMWQNRRSRKMVLKRLKRWKNVLSLLWLPCSVLYRIASLLKCISFYWLRKNSHLNTEATDAKLSSGTENVYASQNLLLRQGVRLKTVSTGLI